MQLVYEDYNVPGPLHLAQHVLYAVFKVAAVLRPGQQRSEVQRYYALVREALRHLTSRDPAGQRLGHGRLAHARLADQDGVVLAAAREYLYAAVELPLAAHHRVHASRRREGRKVAAVLVKHARLHAADGVFNRCLSSGGAVLPRLGAEKSEYRRAERSCVPARAFHRARGGASRRLQYAQQYVLGAHIALAERAGVLGGVLERGARVRAQALLGPALRARTAHQSCGAGERSHIQPRRGENSRPQASGLRRHAQQQMLCSHIAVPQRRRRVPRRTYCRRSPVRKSDGVFHSPCLLCHYSRLAARDAAHPARQLKYNRRAGASDNMPSQKSRFVIATAVEAC